MGPLQRWMNIFILPRSWICARFKVGVVYCASYCKSHLFPECALQVLCEDQIILNTSFILHDCLKHRAKSFANIIKLLLAFWIICLWHYYKHLLRKKKYIMCHLDTWLICRLRLSSFRILVHIFLLFVNHIILPASKFLSLKAHFSSSAGYNNLGLTYTGQETDWQPLVTRENWVFPFELVSGC